MIPEPETLTDTDRYRRLCIWLERRYNLGMRTSQQAPYAHPLWVESKRRYDQARHTSGSRYAHAFLN